MATDTTIDELCRIDLAVVKTQALSLYQTYVGDMAQIAKLEQGVELQHLLRISGYVSREAYLRGMVTHVVKQVDKLFEAHEKRFPG